MTAFSYKKGDNEVTGDFSKLEKLVENLEKKYYVDIGILGAGGKTEKGGITLAGIGAVHEFGTDKAGRNRNTRIPERSFIRMPLETGQEDIEKEIDPHLQKLMEDGDIKEIFELIGIAGAGRIEEAFNTKGFGTWKELADSTISGRKKGPGKHDPQPLIDEGTLHQSITFRVGGG